MKAIMNSHFAWLLKREYWESRRGFLWAQIWTAIVLLAISVLGIITLEIFRSRWNHDISINTHGTNLGDLLSNALNHNIPLVVKGLDLSMMSFGVIASIVMTFVVFFYLLGALYDDRRDRSILFWKSLPVSDTSTVLSKVVSGLVVAPLIAVCVVLAGYLCDQVIHSVWFAAHGVNPFPLIWAHVEPFSLWLHLLAAVPVYAAWALPTAGWLLFWSALVRSKPFLWAVVVPVLAGLLNFWIGLLGLPHIGNEFFLNNLFSRALLGLIPGSWMWSTPGTTHIVADVSSHGPAALISYSSLAEAFTLPQMWIGAIVGIGLIAVAIWLRRWRAEA